MVDGGVIGKVKIIFFFFMKILVMMFVFSLFVKERNVKCVVSCKLLCYGCIKELIWVLERMNKI